MIKDTTINGITIIFLVAVLIASFFPKKSLADANPFAPYWTVEKILIGNQCQPVILEPSPMVYLNDKGHLIVFVNSMTQEKDGSTDLGAHVLCTDPKSGKIL